MFLHYQLELVCLIREIKKISFTRLNLSGYIYIPCVEEHNTANISSSNIMSTRLVLLSVLALNSYKLQSGNE